MKELVVAAYCRVGNQEQLTADETPSDCEEKQEVEQCQQQEQ